jgi:hypothetical protein
MSTSSKLNPKIREARHMRKAVLKMDPPANASFEERQEYYRARQFLNKVHRTPAMPRHTKEVLFIRVIRGLVNAPAPAGAEIRPIEMDR